MEENELRRCEIIKTCMMRAALLADDRLNKELNCAHRTSELLEITGVTECFPSFQ